MRIQNASQGENQDKKLFTTQFYLLCLSSFFFFLSFNSIVPELIIYVDEVLGAPASAGWVLAIFTLVAGLSRPFSGRMTDHWGRLPVMVIGGMASMIACIGYTLIDDIVSRLVWMTPVLLFFGIRAFHGMSTGFKPTGTAAFLADIVPVKRRGEGMGWLGFAGSIGMALGPKLGNYLHLEHGYDLMFWVAAGFAVLSILVIAGMKETLASEQRKPPGMHLLAIRWRDVYEPRVMTPTLVFMLYATAFGAVFTLIPIKTNLMGVDEFRGTFFLIYLGFTTFSRVIAGRISDQVGRPVVVFVGVLSVVFALAILGWTETVVGLIVGGALYGLAHGTVGPTLFAWTIDLSNAEHKGRAFSTMFIGMEIGIGVGSLFSNYIYLWTGGNLSMAFVFVMIACMTSLGYLYYRTKLSPHLVR